MAANASNDANHDRPASATVDGIPPFMSAPATAGNSGKNGYSLQAPGWYGRSYQSRAIIRNHCPSIDSRLPA